MAAGVALLEEEEGGYTQALLAGLNIHLALCGARPLVKRF